MFSLDNKGQLEASFNDFISRPENKPAIEKIQHKEVRNALKLQEIERQIDLEREVSALPPDVRSALAPALRHDTLRRVMMTFKNDGTSSFATWACHPGVTALLTSAADALQEGRIAPRELEQVLVSYLKNPVNPEHDQFERASRATAKLPPHMLAAALNEHLAERRGGAAAFKGSDFDTALHHYKRALAVVEFVEASNEDDAKEVDTHRTAVLVCIAETELSRQNYGAAVTHASRALEANAVHAGALLVRARAYVARQEYEAALKDVAAILDVEPHNTEASALQAHIPGIAERDRVAAKNVYKRMFK